MHRYYAGPVSKTEQRTLSPNIHQTLKPVKIFGNVWQKNKTYSNIITLKPEESPKNWQKLL